MSTVSTSQSSLLPNASGKGNYSIAELNANFKPTFENRSKNMYSTLDVLEGRIKKKFNFTGSEKNLETQLSFAGGFGARLLPKANNSLMENQKIIAKKVYGRALVDREGLKAASNSQGAYQQYLKFPIKKTVEGYVNQCGRILFGDGSGILGRGDAATNVTGTGAVNDPFIVTISEATWKRHNFHKKAFVQVVTGLAALPDNTGGAMEGGDALTNILEVVSVVDSTRKVGLVGVSAHLTALSGAGPVAATTGFCMQRSYLGEPTGLGEALMKTTGTFQGIAIQPEWKAGQLDAGGQGIITDMINEMMLERQDEFGEEPNMIVCRWNQYQKILAQIEDKKVYMLPNKNVKGHLGFEGIEYVCASGKKISVVTHRHADADKVYLLNDAYLERLHRPDFGWFDEDGTVFLRTSEDEYEARYGGYWEHQIVPTAHAVIHNLAK
jgi:hypothetical protein